jgi:beta-lactamase class D OXA-29
MLQKKFSLSKKAYFFTKKNLYIQNLDKNWKLFGKTGSGNKLTKEGIYDKKLKSGWFVGWIEKQDKIFVFVQFIEDSKKEPEYAGPRAKKEAIKNLENFITYLNLL